MDIIKRIEERYNVDETSLEALKLRLSYLEDCKYDMEELFKNLLTNRNMLPFITELNVISELLMELDRKGITYDFEYEPVEENGNPDIKIIIDGIIFRIQIKRFTNSKYDNMLNKTLDVLYKELEKIEKGFFFVLTHSEFVDVDDVYEFVEYVKSVENNIVTGFEISDYITASGCEFSLEFFKPNKSEFTHLKHGGSVGSARWVSGEIDEQLSDSTIKALKSVPEVDHLNEVNLVFAESQSFQDIDFGNVIYGDEVAVIQGGHYVRNERKTNGLMFEQSITNKLSSYIAIYNNNSISGDYTKSLFTLADGVEVILSRYFDFDKIYDSTTFIE